jgi:hypothetical protein
MPGLETQKADLEGGEWASKPSECMESKETRTFFAEPRLEDQALDFLVAAKG